MDSDCQCSTHCTLHNLLYAYGVSLRSARLRKGKGNTANFSYNILFCLGKSALFGGQAFAYIVHFCTLHFCTFALLHFLTPK